MLELNNYYIPKVENLTDLSISIIGDKGYVNKRLTPELKLKKRK